MTKKIKLLKLINLKELELILNVPKEKLRTRCSSLGIKVSCSQRLDYELLTLVASEFGYEVELIEKGIRTKKKEMISRDPVIILLGHVDHGKTSLLDYIKRSQVNYEEYGGITQNIGVYKVNINKKNSLTFIDTPGHEAFMAMRYRGTQITDIAIIVIATDEDIMPHTNEAINNAQAVGIPIIFAFNKIDTNTSDPEKIMRKLAERNILVEEWGGAYQSQEISAKYGIGIDKLIEKIILEAELLNLKYSKENLAVGSIIESSLNKENGYTATIIIKDGILFVGDYILVGKLFGKVIKIIDERGNQLKYVLPSRPVLIFGLNGAPASGEIFNSYKTEKEVKNIFNKFKKEQEPLILAEQEKISFHKLEEQEQQEQQEQLNLIIKADLNGSIEAITESLENNNKVNLISKRIGNINESDVLLAYTYKAMIVGFKVKISDEAKKLANKNNIVIKSYNLIYKLENKINEFFRTRKNSNIKDFLYGRAKVTNFFTLRKIGIVAGCLVLEGKIVRNSTIKLKRDDKIIYVGKLNSLKNLKKDVNIVKQGSECGINIKKFKKLKIGDIIESYRII
ncbi:translation initiation factor IF-2 [Candidatus Karelsulcia muelleri]|uniref:translation initiation factor IF-2 n=1 Tax=Candidatus Karelsulcia muelleri TaxID=336810 RepID=UPI0023686D08|nr:translation initiation factor IF-2 [Candidatus Karelsulcia muelleri]WDI79611.1 translation initiation factor IF-2 [Candidatus Karelsulcia muelleri]WDR78933.1 translation initiation factor IF-2 [Candidatus Karelsulcia muelleri]